MFGSSRSEITCELHRQKAASVRCDIDARRPLVSPDNLNRQSGLFVNWRKTNNKMSVRKQTSLLASFWGRRFPIQFFQTFPKVLHTFQNYHASASICSSDTVGTSYTAQRQFPECRFPAGRPPSLFGSKPANTLPTFSRQPLISRSPGLHITFSHREPPRPPCNRPSCFMIRTDVLYQQLH